jgi:imidazolonepropionase-like amidohydrolase
MKKICSLIALSWTVALFAEAPLTFAIRNARIVTVSGPILQRGTVVMRDGLIQDVGENVAVPADAWVIEGEGLTVYPGLIDALNAWGIRESSRATSTASRRRPAAVRSPVPRQPSAVARGPEDRPSNTSWRRAADMVNPKDRRIETWRNAGFTSAVAFPTGGIFTGQGAVINLAGKKPGEMVVCSPAGLYLGFSTSRAGGFPVSLMGVMAYVRQIFLDADHYRRAKQLYARNAAGRKRPAYDRALEGMLDAPRVLLPASRAVEIERMLRLAAEIKANTVLYGGHEAYRVAELLRQSGTPVLVSLNWPERNKDADPEQVESLRVTEMRERAPSTPATLVKAGVRFAFFSGGIAKPGDVLKGVRRALVAGLSQDDAVRALTLSPSEVYGVDDRLGSVDKGKIANLVVTNGDLFQDSTKVKYVFVDGKKFEPAPEMRKEKKP